MGLGVGCGKPQYYTLWQEAKGIVAVSIIFQTYLKKVDPPPFGSNLDILEFQTFLTISHPLERTSLTDYLGIFTLNKIKFD